METWQQLIIALADGRFHSGEALATSMGVSRAAIWKRIRKLRQLPGLQVQSVRGRGYRLAEPLELLEETRLKSCLAGAVQDLRAVHLLSSISSTNEYLTRNACPPVGKGELCLSEHQTAGRGRRGRSWVSGYGQNVMLSLAWRFDLPMSALSGISLAAGVALAETLTRLGIQGHGLKWPNDLYLEDKKIAGILVEAIGESDGPVLVIIGLGLNLRLPPEVAQEIDQPWADLSSTTVGLPSRHQIAAEVSKSLIAACQGYQSHGIKPYREAWEAYDLFLGKQIEIRRGDQRFPGRYTGLNGAGELLLETEQGQMCFQSGEVSLRPVS